jgi:hypothetical protein
MATSEPLVPTGQEYGARQETVAAMRNAGLPLAPTTVRAGGARTPNMPAPPPATRFRPDYDPLLEADPSALPGVSGEAPVNPYEQAAPDSYAMLADTAGSALVREVARRLAARGA